MSKKIKVKIKCKESQFKTLLGDCLFFKIDIKRGMKNIMIEKEKFNKLVNQLKVFDNIGEKDGLINLKYNG